MLEKIIEFCELQKKNEKNMSGLMSGYKKIKNIQKYSKIFNNFSP
jgi:hypothetical protein